MLFITTLMAFTNVIMINSLFTYKGALLEKQTLTFEELNFLKGLNYSFCSEIPGSLYVHEYDSLSTRELQLFWNPNQSCVQTVNQTRVDCVDKKSRVLTTQPATHICSPFINLLSIFNQPLFMTILVSSHCDAHTNLSEHVPSSVLSHWGATVLFAWQHC